MQWLHDGEYSRECSPHAVTTCLEVLSQPGGAALRVHRANASTEPVVLVTFEPGGWLQLDLTASAQLRPALKAGAEFVLIGQLNGKMMRSQPLKVQSWQEVGGRIECFCGYPEYFDIVQRRETFRAELRLGMRAMAAITCGGHSSTGQLRNLSVKGCLVEFTTEAEPLLAALQGERAGEQTCDETSEQTREPSGERPREQTRERPSGIDKVPEATIELSFPNGTRFGIQGTLRHHVIDREAPYIRIGFLFIAPTSRQERQLWQFVREVEREAARFIAADYSTLEPSPLFRAAQSASRRSR